MAKSTFDRWKAAATPDEVAVAVCLNRRLFRQFADAIERLEGLREDGMLEQSDEFRDLAQQVVELGRQVEADKAEHVFVFSTVPYTDWRSAVEAHAPTEEQQAENRYLDYNPDTFPQAAIALSCTSPELTPADAEWLRENLPRFEFDRLFDGAMKANMAGSSVPKSVSGIVGRLGSALNSTTPPPEESPSPSSEDE